MEKFRDPTIRYAEQVCALPLYKPTSIRFTKDDRLNELYYQDAFFRSYTEPFGSALTSNSNSGASTNLTNVVKKGILSAYDREINDDSVLYTTKFRGEEVVISRMRDATNIMKVREDFPLPMDERILTICFIREGMVYPYLAPKDAHWRTDCPYLDNIPTGENILSTMDYNNGVSYEPLAERLEPAMVVGSDYCTTFYNSINYDTYPTNKLLGFRHKNKRSAYVWNEFRRVIVLHQRFGAADSIQLHYLDDDDGFSNPYNNFGIGSSRLLITSEQGMSILDPVPHASTNWPLDFPHE